MRGLVAHALVATLFAIFCVFQLGGPALAQITFERTYGGAHFDEGYSVQQTSDSGYIITGYTRSFGTGGSNVYLIRTDSRGDVLWSTTYGPAHARGYSVQQTSDGGYIIGGFTNGLGEGGDFYLIKTDSGGDKSWEKNYGGTELDWGFSVTQTVEGGYVVAGYTYSFGLSLGDAYLIKTDSLGNMSWDSTYGSDQAEKGFSVQQTSDGGYIISGFTTSFGPYGFNIYLVKTDSMGEVVWEGSYGELKTEIGYSVRQTSDRGYIVCGPGGAGHYSGDVYLVKTDSLGEISWETTYGGSSGDWGHSVHQTSDGGYVITGTTVSLGSGQWDVYVIKTDSLGNALWDRTYGGSEDDYGYSVQQTLDGGYIIAGWTESFGAGEADVYLIKTDSLGQVLGIQEQDRELKTEKRTSLQNQPNPFHGSTMISYSLPASTHVTLQVFDITGRLVETLVNKTQEHGSYQVQWNSNDNPTGIYFCRLQAGDFTDTRKMLLLR